MTTKDFFHKIINKTPDDEFLYYADKVHELGDEVPNDLFPIDFLMVKVMVHALLRVLLTIFFLLIKDENFDPSQPHRTRATHVWMGPRGATTHTHYGISLYTTAITLLT